MNKRLFIMFTILVAIGVVTGAFSSSIARALTPPLAKAQTGSTNQGQHSTGTRTPSGQSNQPTPMASTPTMVLAQDTFRRTNQQLWGQASDGRSWQGDANTLATFSIHAFTGQIAGEGTVNAILGDASGNVGVLASGQMNQFDGAANMGIVLRWTDNLNWYKALIDGQHLIILKSVNGVSTQLSSVPFHAQNGIIYTIHFQVIGVLLFARVWRSGTTEPEKWMITLSDSSLRSGRAGLRFVLQSTTVINMTSFLATPAAMGGAL
jgi:hypothetical protein